MVLQIQLMTEDCVASWLRSTRLPLSALEGLDGPDLAELADNFDDMFDHTSCSKLQAKAFKKKLLRLCAGGYTPPDAGLSPGGEPGNPLPTPSTPARDSTHTTPTRGPPSTTRALDATPTTPARVYMAPESVDKRLQELVDEHVAAYNLQYGVNMTTRLDRQSQEIHVLTCLLCEHHSGQTVRGYNIANFFDKHVYCTSHREYLQSKFDVSTPHKRPNDADVCSVENVKDHCATTPGWTPAPNGSGVECDRCGKVVCTNGTRMSICKLGRQMENHTDSRACTQRAAKRVKLTARAPGKEDGETKEAAAPLKQGVMHRLFPSTSAAEHTAATRAHFASMTPETSSTGGSSTSSSSSNAPTTPSRTSTSSTSSCSPSTPRQPAAGSPTATQGSTSSTATQSS